MFEFIESLKVLAKENQVIAGAISLWGLTTLSYVARNYPKTIWNFIVRHTTIVVTLTSAHEVYGLLLKWIYNKKLAKRSRTLKLSSDYDAIRRINKTATFVTMIGYGTHFFLYNFRPLIINITKNDEAHSYKERDTVEIRLFGKSHKNVNKLLSELSEIDDEQSTHFIKLYRWGGKGSWRFQQTRKRKIESVFLQKGIKEEIINFIDNFTKQESWYIDHGLNYQTGILLYGPPGTGKTSLIRAIASHRRSKLYTMSSSSLGMIGEASYEMDDNSILVIEDIDTNNLTTKRTNSNKTEKVYTTAIDTRSGEVVNQNEEIVEVVESPQSNMPNLFDFIFENLSDVLNALDGLLSKHGRILIATTNHIDNLDPALIRDGRFDLKIKLDYATNEILDDFLVSFYGTHIPKGYQIKDGVSSATIQTLIMKNLDSPHKVLEKLEHENSPIKIKELKN